MDVKDIIAALTIHLILPLAGLLWFLRLRKQMKDEVIPNAPTAETFLIFSTYGGLLLVALTTLFWKWSAMGTLGTLYLIFVAPILMGIIAYQNRKTRIISKYHNWTYLSGVLYFIITPVAFILLFLMSNN